MKTIYQVGKLNEMAQKLNSSLSEYFEVQLCPEHVELLRGMLEMEEPDLILISLADMEQSHVEIFTELKFGYFHIPVICVGTQEEREGFGRFIGTGQFQGVDSSVSGRELADMINIRLTAGSAGSPKAKAFGVQAEQTPQALQASQAVQAPPAALEKPEVKKKILLVDDNAIQLRSLKACLQNRYEVSMAISGAEAIALIGKSRPDLIFLDYEMPVCDGKMTLEMIRSLEGGRDIPIVFLTGINDKEHIAAVLKLKPAGYLLKPADSERIHEIIHKLIES